MELRTPRGTRDYLPEEMFFRRYIFRKIREIFERYGYGEVQTPAFEHLELLEAKAGEEVKDQIYWFKDKAGRRLGLRFEMTTPIARIVASNPMMPKPLRFYYIQPVWRYEEPQKGRLREFYHAGVEFIGVSSPSADAEVIMVAYQALKNCGLKNIKIKINDRRIIEYLLRSFGVMDEKIDNSMRILDKLERRGRKYVISELSKVGLSFEKGRELLKVLNIKGCNYEKLENVRGYLSNISEGIKGIENLDIILEELYNGYNLSENEIEIDFTIVRGLAYYTGFVFEIKVVDAPDIGSVAGGGRYDNLIGLIGGRDFPATGMAIGVERVMEALNELKTPVPLKYNICDVIVIPLRAKYIIDAIRIAEKLRENGISTILDVTGRRISSALEYADKMKIRYAIIVGEREIKEGKYTLRDLKEWKEEKLSMSEIITRVL
ncbi:MAG: histidine--tRNA ligase [Thermoproteales archaeon]|nr:histidine--tRNA ligase [Thermoproteales archaeon]